MKVTTYLQVEATHFAGGVPRRGKVARVTTKYPYSAIPGCVIVKLTLDLDDAIWVPLEATATVDIDHADRVPVKVEEPDVEAEAV